MKTSKSHNSYKNHWIIMTEWYDQLQIMTNYPTIYESCQTNNLNNVLYNYIENVWKCLNPIAPSKIVVSKLKDHMINYTSWPIILPYMKAIWPMTLEGLYSQIEVGLTNRQTEKLYSIQNVWHKKCLDYTVYQWLFLTYLCKETDQKNFELKKKFHNT